MAETTGIGWADATFNPWIGCTKVSPGCDNCYAATLDANRFSKTLGGGTKAIPVSHWGAGAPRHRTATWGDPKRWNAKAVASGKPMRVFCASLADVFDNEVPASWHIRLFDLIRECPALTWMLLTKRVGNVPVMLPPDWGNGWPNVWLGITVVNQEEADRDIPKLLRIPAAVRWLSMEPLLGPVDLRRACEGFRWTDPDGVNCCGATRLLDWVIVGGESGKEAREFDPTWARSIRDQCAKAGVPFFMKQLGAKPQEIAYPGDVTEAEAATWMRDGWSRISHAGGAFPMHWRRYIRLVDRAGANPDEWPMDLRVQQWPQVVA